MKGKRDETTLPMEVTNDEDENDEKKLMSVVARGRAHKKPNRSM
jgi:hypothetical protein